MQNDHLGATDLMLSFGGQGTSPLPESRDSLAGLMNMMATAPEKGQAGIDPYDYL